MVAGVRKEITMGQAILKIFVAFFTEEKIPWIGFSDIFVTYSWWKSAHNLLENIYTKMCVDLEENFKQYY